MPFRDSVLTVDMNFEAADGLIGDRGTNMIHEIGVRCPCIRTDTERGAVGQSDPNCKQCRGRGWMYRDMVYMRGLVTSMSANAQWAQVGWVFPGDLIFSPQMKNRRISNFDRITATVPQPTEGQVIVRGEAAVFSPRTDDLRDNEDLLFWESGRQQAIWLEDEDGVVYHPGQYMLNGRRIEWIGDFGPAIGKKYGVKYEAYFEYLCWIPPAERWDHQRELGQRIMLRRAVVDTNPGNHGIVAPWEVRVGENLGYDNPYSLYTDALYSAVDPQR